MSISRTFDGVRELEHAAADPSRFAALGPELAEQLTAIYLRRYHLRLHRLGAVLTLLDPAERRAPSPAVNGKRVAWRGDELHLERVRPLLQDPWATLSAAYLPNGLATAADAHAAAGRLFPLIRAAANALGLGAASELRSLLPDSVLPIDDLDRGDGPDVLPDDDEPTGDLSAFYKDFEPRVTLMIPQLQADGTFAGTFLGVAVTASSREHPGGQAGLIIELTGALNWAQTRGPWTLTASSQGTIPAFVAGPGGIKLAAPAPAASARLLVARGGTTGPAFVFGPANGTRLELGALTAQVDLALGPANSAAVAVKAASGKLVITPGDGDGFVAAVLPSGGMSVDFDVGIALSTARGFELSGGAGLDATLPVHVGLGPVGSVDTVHLSLLVGETVRADVAAGLTVRVGPVAVSVDGIGVRATTTFGDGNLGVADLDVLFKAPTLLGLSIDAGPVSGGGFLEADRDHGQYAGEIHLEFEGIAVRALGLLTTTATGYSLLVLISADFPPVQLGLGFMLVGVGGLLGLNRTINVDALRAGLKTGALGAVLSPPDPKASAAQIVANLATLFPPAGGRHVFAPTARIVWGTPVLITIELALALELPSPVRLVALGRLRAIIPDEREATVVLKVDILGVIDFDRAEAAVDATLADSRIAQFTLTGDLALRMSWGENSTFLLAVGGFHPRFAAPPGFPALQRVAVALASGDNPKLRLEAYFAMTSNTVQFGARLDVGARAGSFSIGGFMSFDALVTLSPLSFVVDIAAKLAVKMGSHTILSISLDLTLSGPRPWHAHGRASFSILFFDISFSFDVTIGDPTPTALPSPVDVGPLLLAALSDLRAWSAPLPTGASAGVSLRALAPGAKVLAHPLATLEVRQRVAPLDRQLDRFGTSVPSGAKRFRITQATIGTVHPALTPLQDRFAPAQFTAMSDDEKLSAPSFVAMTSGTALGADGYLTGTAITVNLVHEELLVPAAGVIAPPRAKVAMPGDVFVTLTATAPARAPVFAIREVA